jgi:hypothetical protein
MVIIDVNSVLGLLNGVCGGEEVILETYWRYMLPPLTGGNSGGSIQEALQYRANP